MLMRVTRPRGRWINHSRQTKFYINETFQSHFQIMNIMIFDFRRVVELCSQPTGTTSARRRLTSNLRMAWNGRNTIRHADTSRMILGLFHWYCYQKTDPVRETSFPILGLLLKTGQEYSEGSWTMSSRYALQHTFFSVSCPISSPMTNRTCWNCHNPSAPGELQVANKMRMNQSACAL